MRLNLKKNLPALRAAAYSAIDAEAEQLRLQFITPGDGQAMTYQQKKLEAEAYLANTSISPAEIPHISLEAEINGYTLMEQASLVVILNYQWQQISALIEKVRMTAKSAVNVAANPRSIDEAAIVDWSSVLELASRS
jgi:hypothetical protein